MNHIINVGPPQPQPQRPPPFLEPFRSPVAPPPQEREPFFIGGKMQGPPVLLNLP